ncbi:hypothetical protein CHS0354_024747 [Potamilus streckersoni]|uniref:Uncharacterized protein n=1 Tax=Potamilus streckersoni TaxID=2493646 RepID=A0AAE0VLG3_9BIVA|nr:hypothetical protein CHS0354_024747 [Potamilus streckersoni]
MISVIITVTSNVTVSNIFNGYGASIRLPRRSRSPSFMNSLGASERFHSPDIRPTLDQGKYFGRPVVPQPFRPVETRGTKKPHESGQSPPLTGIAKRMITTIRYREIISKGDRIGVALVTFVTSEKYSKELEKNGSLMNNRVGKV